MQDVEIKKRILDWCGPNFPLEIREEAAKIFHRYLQGDRSDDVFAFMTELKFGTGGLRGVIGLGPGRMNEYTVGKTTLGFANYLLKEFKQPSVVIAYDSRRKSFDFAKITAGIFANKNIKVYLFDQVAPTPILSYAIRKLKASGGVVITASHNPPEYNGYKVYQDDGSQIVGETQTKIEKEIDAIPDWNIPFLDSEDPKFKEMVKYIGDDIKKMYYGEFDSIFFVKKAEKPIKVVFSPLHGTSGKWLPELLEKYGVEVIPVNEQMEPNGEFPTVKYPNPEEPEALTLCKEVAQKVKADLFVATDPDADRMGTGIRDSHGNYVLLTGNQIGSILLAYLAEKIKRHNDKRYFVYKTIVTTNLQKEIAKKNNLHIIDLLTGFKYIAEQMRWIEEGKYIYNPKTDVYLFGSEESYGYLPIDFVRDKDSLSSTLLLTMAAIEKGNLLSYLDEIYLKYGLYLEDLKSVAMKGLDGLQKMNQIIEKLRSTPLIGKTLDDRKIIKVYDYKYQWINQKPDPEYFKILPKSDVIQFELEPEGLLTIRPSGTEPKVKIYISLRSKEHPQSIEELKIRKEELEKEINTIMGYFLAISGLS
ncbi:MAG: phospho-sugar mutase [Leptospiraceae bacterium]|nr:phospho-sugar mutase [Leptospiraceae bacterium]MDW7977001.1 phospho-sugar mutase [Leptospiraceae bacterium]